MKCSRLGDGNRIDRWEGIHTGQEVRSERLSGVYCNTTKQREAHLHTYQSK